MDDLPQVVAALAVLLGLPWLIFHYVTKWKTAATLTRDDEALIADLHDLARRLDERVRTVERIVTADNPNWRELGCEPAPAEIDNSTETLRRIK